MPRTAVAVLLANVAAPCLLVLFIFAKGILFEPAEPGSDWRDVLSVVPLILLMCWAGMAVSILPLSLLVAFLGRKAGWTGRWFSMAAGSAMGIGAVHWIVPWVFGPSEAAAELYPLYASIGAICGWIYWRVALAEEPTVT